MVFEVYQFVFGLFLGDPVPSCSNSRQCSGCFSVMLTLVPFRVRRGLTLALSCCIFVSSRAWRLGWCSFVANGVGSSVRRAHELYLVRIGCQAPCFCIELSSCDAPSYLSVLTLHDRASMTVSVLATKDGTACYVTLTLLTCRLSSLKTNHIVGLVTRQCLIEKLGLQRCSMTARSLGFGKPCQRGWTYCPTIVTYIGLDDCCVRVVLSRRCVGRTCVRSDPKECYLVDPASSHMLVSKIKPCMSKYARPVQ